MVLTLFLKSKQKIFLLHSIPPGVPKVKRRLWLQHGLPVCKEPNVKGPCLKSCLLKACLHCRHQPECLNVREGGGGTGEEFGRTDHSPAVVVGVHFCPGLENVLFYMVAEPRELRPKFHNVCIRYCIYLTIL